MNPSANPSFEYLKSAVNTASPEQLQLMLYDGAIRFTTRGLEGLHANDREAAFLGFDRAQRIVVELMNGIRREVNPELADQMDALYNFIYRRLITANLNQDETAGNDALRILKYQRETWVLLMEKLQHDAHGSPTPRPPLPVTKISAPPARPTAASPPAGAPTVAGLNLEG